MPARAGTGRRPVGQHQIVAHRRIGQARAPRGAILTTINPPPAGPVMAATDLSTRRRTPRRVKLDTLIGLRWIAITGQTGAILTLGLGLGFPMPVGLCFAVVALSAWLNLFLKLRFPSSLRLRDTAAALLLGYDVLQFGMLIYLTGGLQNPFALLIPVPAIVSATTLSLRHTAALGALTLAAITVLWWVHYPLPWPSGEIADLPLLYVGGMWAAILCMMLFACVYAYRVAREARQLSDALSATELVLEREHHLSALDGLAAAAAHELGTPLATITVVAKELQRVVPPGSPEAADIALLISQSQRCREILARLSSLPGEADWSRGHQPLTHLLAEALEPYGEFDIKLALSVGEGDGPVPAGRRNPGIIYGIGNLVENAVDFAATRVSVTVSWTADEVMVEIADDGPGFAADILDRIGEPYVTTRDRPDDPDKPEHEAGGLGLGFFIAKTLLERSGARLKFANRPAPERGAVVRVTWPRSAYDDGGGGAAAPATVGPGAVAPYNPARQPDPAGALSQ